MGFSISIWALLLAALAGIIMAVQGSLNAALSKTIGLLATALLVHVTGTAVILLALLLPPGNHWRLNMIGQAPWYTLLGGALGVVIVLTVAFSIPRAGVANATTVIIVGQLITAMLIDHFGLFGLPQISFTWFKGLGLLLLAGGGFLVLCR